MICTHTYPQTHPSAHEFMAPGSIGSENIIHIKKKKKKRNGQKSFLKAYKPQIFPPCQKVEQLSLYDPAEV